MFVNFDHSLVNRNILVVVLVIIFFIISKLPWFGSVCLYLQEVASYQPDFLPVSLPSLELLPFIY